MTADRSDGIFDTVVVTLTIVLSLLIGCLIGYNVAIENVRTKASVVIDVTNDEEIKYLLELIVENKKD